MYCTSYICYARLVADKRWTFLSNHGHLLLCLANNADTKVRDLAIDIGITERAVLGIISDLETAGYISIEKIGRRNKYKVNKNLTFRHELESHKKIGDLIRVFS